MQSASARLGQPHKQGGRGGRLRNLFKDRVLKPLVIASFVIFFGAAGPLDASARDRPQKTREAGIVFQSDTLALVQASKPGQPLPPSIQSGLEEMLSKISHSYPDAVKKWREGQLREGLPHGINLLDTIRVELVNPALFEQVEDAGQSVRWDDFQTLYVNTGAAFRPDEMALRLSQIFSRGGGFGSPTPFHDAYISDLIPSLMAATLVSDSARAPAFSAASGGEGALGEHGACALWFAQLMGSENFVKAYFERNTSVLREEYERALGPGRYDPLVSSGHPMRLINQHMRQAGLKADAWEQVEPLAKKLNLNLARPASGEM